MKKLSFKGFIAGFVVCSILSTGLTVFGETSKTIQAVFGRVKLVVNGSNVDKETLLYNGTTYLPLRDVAEITGLNVDWDSDTNVATLTTTTAATATPKTETAQPKKEIAYYPEYSTVPDYGKMFGVEPMYAKPSDGSLKGMNYLYHLDDSSSGNYNEYIKALETAGFKCDKATGYYSDDNVILAVVHSEDSKSVIIAIMPFGKDGNGIPNTYSSPTTTTQKVTPVAPIEPVKPAEPSKTVEPSKPKEDANTSKSVYITKTGKKYHYDSSCNGGTYFSSTLSAAQSKGLTACSKCVN